MPAEQLAGHPIAIRVGGRRMSQSNPPVRSPSNKSQASQSPSASPEDRNASTGREPVPDYPRPAGPPSATPKETEPQAAATATATAESTLEREREEEKEEARRNEPRNRQERRRQERNKKNNDEDGGGHRRQLSYEGNKLWQDPKQHRLKTAKDNLKRTTIGTAGTRITQPVGKGLA